MCVFLIQIKYRFKFKTNHKVHRIFYNHTENLNPMIIRLVSLLLWTNPFFFFFFFFWIVLIMSDTNNAENYTEIALIFFQRGIFFCNNDFQSSCDFCSAIFNNKLSWCIRQSALIRSKPKHHLTWWYWAVGDRLSPCGYYRYRFIFLA